MQLFAHSFFNNAGLLFLMRFNHKQANVAEGKSTFSHHNTHPPQAFICATSAQLRRRQQVTGSQAKHTMLDFAPSLSRERGNLRSRFRISASISLSLPPPELSLPGPQTAIQMLCQLNAPLASSLKHQLSKPRNTLHVRRESQVFLEYISPPFN